MYSSSCSSSNEQASSFHISSNGGVGSNEQVIWAASLLAESDSCAR